MQNILRDFQKKSQYGNLPFSRQFFYQIQLDMAKKKCVLTNSMAKWKNCTSQIFHFWNFVTEIFVKHVERFSKNENWWKLAIFRAILIPDQVGYGWQIICQHCKHGQIKKMYISEFWFLKLCHRDFCRTYWEIFKKCQIMKIGHTLGHFTTRSGRLW